MTTSATTSLIETVNANLHLMSGKDHLHILKDISLTVAPSEVVAIVGPSGSARRPCSWCSPVSKRRRAAR